MAHDSSDSRPARGRWVRRAVLVALLAWTGVYAYTRVTTPPARAADPRGLAALTVHSPQPGDASAQMAVLLRRLASPRAAEVPQPPPGMTWDPGNRGWQDARRPLEISDALRGPWALERRPHLTAVVAYLADPDVQATLDALAGLRGRPWGMTVEDDDANVPTAADLRQAAYTLYADARRRHAAEGDDAGAWERLRTTLWLGATRPQGALLGWLSRPSFMRQTLQELRALLMERAVPDSVLGAAQAELAAQPEFATTWREMVREEEAIGRQLIDMTFTGTRSGNGWLVANVRVDDTTASTLPRLWNITSLLYNNRRTVEAKLRRVTFTMQDVALLPVNEAREALAEPPRFNRCDGAVLHSWSVFGFERAYMTVLAVEVERQGTLTMLAIERYRAAHGMYPDRLQEIDAAAGLPPDPLCPSGFVYRRAADRYVLYSRGFDGDDDGGVVPQRYGDRFRDGDFVLTQGRRQALFEPELRSTEADAGGPSGAEARAPSMGR